MLSLTTASTSCASVADAAFSALAGAFPGNVTRTIAPTVSPA